MSFWFLRTEEKKYITFSKLHTMEPDSEAPEVVTEVTEATQEVKSEEAPKIEVVKKPRSEAQKAALEKARQNAAAARAAKKVKPPDQEEEEVEYVTRKKKPTKRRIVVVEASSEEEEEIEVRLPKKKQPPPSPSKIATPDPQFQRSMEKMFGSL
tara:strand:+ start:1225 stop:1686 length:462 start_codon:yes stop_codon:yes gene_type:complete